ncbi:hypothetical protein ACTXT7_000689 [Hymenolepis weldensis]
MDNVSPSQIDGIWKMLDEMATTDPVNYQKFILEQMKRLPELISQPQCRGFLKCTLKQEKNIHTMELDEINTQKLMKFDCIWCSEPYGGESEMLKSLHYKKFSLTDIPKQLLKLNEDVPVFGDVSTNVDPKIKLSVTESNENSKLIHEVKPNPCWQLRKPNKKPNTCEYKIILPIGSKIENCELDISQTTLSLQLRNNSEYPEAFCAQFEKPIDTKAAKARYNRTKHCLSVDASFL